MVNHKGFFSPESWSVKKPLDLVPQCGMCGIYKECTNPKMPVSGDGLRKVLIVGEAPGQHEDAKNLQFVGPAGIELHRLLSKIGVKLRRDCWITNALICRPTTDEGKNRTPTKEEINHCRPSLSKTLNELKPDVIIPMGKVAVQSLIPLAWKDDEVDNIGRWVGWKIPSMKLNSWITPTYHPSFLLRGDDTGEEQEKVPAQVVEMFMMRHLEIAFSLKGKPWDAKPDYDSMCVETFSSREAWKLIEKMLKKQVPLAVDLETTTLKPDGSQAEIICCAVSDGEKSVAYPWREDTKELTRQVIHSEASIISSNLRFEERWFRKEFGKGVKNWFHDTVLGAHWLDCRRGICSLKFQSFVLLGMEDYDSHLHPYMSEKDSNKRNRLREVGLKTLLHYCALDSLLEILVYEKQNEVSNERNMEGY